MNMIPLLRLAFLLVLGTAGSASRPITCAFKWAQNEEEIFIFVKYAHKLDAPAPNNVQHPAVQVDASSLSVHATNGAKAFSLSLNLYDEVDVDATVHTARTFGVELVLPKARRGHWTRLLRDRSKPRNMHRWFEMEGRGPTSRAADRDRKWWRTYPYKCECCRDVVIATVFTDASLRTMQKAVDRLAASPGTESKFKDETMAVAKQLSEKACNRHELASGTLSGGDGTGGALLDAVRGCRYIYNQPAWATRLQGSVVDTMAAVQPNRAALKAAELRDEFRVHTVMEACAASELRLCANTTAMLHPATQRTASAERTCGACRVLVQDLHSFMGRTWAGNNNLDVGKAKMKEAAYLAAQALDSACDQLRSRHAADARTVEQCEQIVESSDERLSRALQLGATERLEALNALCYESDSCKQARKRKKKGKKKGKKRAKQKKGKRKKKNTRPRDDDL